MKNRPRSEVDVVDHEARIAQAFEGHAHCQQHHRQRTMLTAHEAHAHQAPTGSQKRCK